MASLEVSTLIYLQTFRVQAIKILWVLKPGRDLLCVCFFHAVYPPLAEMTDEDKANSWKPGQKKKKSEKVDSTWNPKSKLLKKNVTQISYLTDKPYRGPTLA